MPAKTDLAATSSDVVDLKWEMEKPPNAMVLGDRLLDRFRAR
jgi:hypothetical protein